jgi:hypothetical protein
LLPIGRSGKRNLKKFFRTGTKHIFRDETRSEEAFFNGGII